MAGPANHTPPPPASREPELGQPDVPRGGVATDYKARKRDLTRGKLKGTSSLTGWATSRSFLKLQKQNVSHPAGTGVQGRCSEHASLERRKTQNGVVVRSRSEGGRIRGSMSFLPMKQVQGQSGVNEIPSPKPPKPKQ